MHRQVLLKVSQNPEYVNYFVMNTIMIFFLQFVNGLIVCDNYIIQLPKQMC